MASQIVPPQPGKIDFAGMVGAKRRRMRSGGNVSTLTNNTPKSEPDPSDMPDDDEKTAQTSKCKGATTIPIFLKSECCPSAESQILKLRRFLLLKLARAFGAERLVRWFLF